MSKNKEMLNIFFKIMKNDKKSIDLVTPKNYVKSIKDIDYKKLLDNGYKNLIFDIDNTIMPVNDINVTKDLKEFFENLKKDFNICILSNNGEERVAPVKEALQVKGFANAKKPSKHAYDKALELIDYITLLKEDNAEVYAIKSSIYEELGKKEESRQALEIAKKYNNIFEYKV